MLERCGREQNRKRVWNKGKGVNKGVNGKGG